MEQLVNIEVLVVALRRSDRTEHIEIVRMYEMIVWFPFPLWPLVESLKSVLTIRRLRLNVYVPSAWPPPSLRERPAVCLEEADRQLRGLESRVRPARSATPSEGSC